MQVQESYFSSGRVWKWMLTVSILLNFTLGIHFWYRKTFEYQANQTIMQTHQRFEKLMMQLFENCDRKRQVFETQLDQTLSEYQKKLGTFVHSTPKNQPAATAESQTESAASTNSTDTIVKPKTGWGNLFSAQKAEPAVKEFPTAHSG